MKDGSREIFLTGLQPPVTLRLATSHLALLDPEPVLTLVLWDMDSSQTPRPVTSTVVSPLPFLGGASLPRSAQKAHLYSFLLPVSFIHPLLHPLDGPSAFWDLGLRPKLLFAN